MSLDTYMVKVLLPQPSFPWPESCGVSPSMAAPGPGFLVTSPIFFFWVLTLHPHPFQHGVSSLPLNERSVFTLLPGVCLVL